MAPLRPLFAWALLAYAALETFLTFVRWLEPSQGTVLTRAVGADFTTLVTVGFPMVAVLLVYQVQPALPKTMAKAVAYAALGEYALILFLGVITFVLGLARMFHASAVTPALSHLTLGVAGLGFTALCAFATISLAGLRPR